ncbi:MAG: 3-oxoacyl-ACP synthase [Flavobacteriaceae bacterium]|nr:3-oxoacyl-ACP synthase [Flavobacteriaceae bacterium]
MSLKQELYSACQEFVSTKLQTIEKTIQSNKNALNSETKSSAGDKHETGRAMLQLEMEKAGQQLKVVNEMQLQLAKINPNIETKNSCLGSVIQTDQVNYYLAISMGKIETSGGVYFAISPKSPIGKLLLGTSKGSKITFNSKQIMVKTVA